MKLRAGAPLLKEQPLTRAARQRLRAQAQAAGGLQEVPSLRTRTSDTYATPDGGYQTVIFAGSMNYQDSTGAWQPIDDTLVPSPVSGYTYQNKANAYTLLLPSHLGGAPVKVTAGGQWVSYSLAGARGPGSVAGATDTFASALPGVGVSYTAAPDEVKEAIVLNGPAAPARFSFHVAMSPGLTAKPAGGGVNFVDSSGRTLLQVPAPVVADASGPRSASASAASLTVASARAGAVVTVAVDPGWLAAAGRVWPVTIDPTTVLSPSQDCWISERTPTSHYCGQTTWLVGSGSDLTYTQRALVQFNLSSLPADAQVVDADLALYLSGETTTNTSPLAVRQLTRSWTTAATWNTYDGTHAWAKAGGDFTSTQWGANPTVGGTVNTRVHFDPTALVQNWLDDPTDNANDGFIVKEPTEHTINNEFTFSSAEGTNPPTLTVQWHHMLGLQRWYKLETRTMDERIGSSVNVVSGDLVFHQHDLQIAGTAGLDLVVDRSWNSEESRGDFGDNGWRFSVGPDVHLVFMTDGSVVYHGVSGYVVGFPANNSGGFDKPPGFDGTLAKSGSNYDLTFNSGEVYVFNSAGKLITDQSPRSTATTIRFSYRGDGTLATVTDSQGRTVNFTYNSAGFLTQISESNGPTARTWTYGYNSSNQLTSYTDPLNQVTQYAYNSNGDIGQVTDPAGNVMAITYTCSTCNKVKTITMASGTSAAATWTFTYNSTNTVVNDPNNHNTTFYHNGGSGFTLDEVNKITDANGHSQSLSYDSNYNLATLTDANSPANTWTTTFNSGGDLTGTTQPAVYGSQGASESWGYGAPAPPHYPGSFTGFDGQKYSYGYGSSADPALANDLTSITEPSGAAWTYVYYHDGNPNTLTDPNNNTTTVTETGGNLTKITPPSPLGAETIGYDRLSRITSTTDGKNQLTQFTYDALDRVTQITYNDGTVVKYSYTPDDLVSSVQVNGSTVESFTYNALNQMTSKTVGGTTVNYGFDGVGNLTSFTGANGTVTYSYDPVNKLTNLTGPGGSPVITFTVTNDNLRSSTVFPSGVGDTMATAYDQANRPCLVVTAPSGNIPSPLTCSSTTVNGQLTSYSYSYQDPSTGTDTNRIQSVTNNVTGQTTTNHYNADGELCWAYVGSSTNGCGSPPTGATSYAMDPAGNITSVTANGSTTSLTYNAADELTAAGSTSYSYDADGNLTSASNGLAYAYNALNQATSVTPPGGAKLSLSYVGPGQDELSQAGSDSLINTLQGVSSKTSGTSTYYIRDNQGKLVYEQPPSGSKYYYLFDAKGSVTGLVNSSGSLAGGTTYAYDPYGNLTQGQTTVDNPWLFQGQYSLFEDQASTFGLYHMGARLDQAGIERWTQQDPTGITVNRESPLGQNLYLFADNDPVNRADPSGQQPTCLLNAPGAPDFHWGCFYRCLGGFATMNCANWCIRCAATGDGWWNFSCWVCGACAGWDVFRCYEHCR